VRDAVLQALQYWKMLPGHYTTEPSETGSSFKGLPLHFLPLYNFDINIAIGWNKDILPPFLNISKIHFLGSFTLFRFIHLMMYVVHNMDHIHH